MKLSVAMTSMLLSGLAGSAGCESSQPNAHQERTVKGSVAATVSSEARTVAILWEVSSGSPDYVYKFGEGRVDNGHFSITLPSDPPAEAINSYGLGVGMVVVLAPGVMLAEGRIPAGTSPTSLFVGLSPDRSVIWRAESFDFGDAAPPANFWPLDFPPGLGCGACAAAPVGSSFDSFTPTACDGIVVVPSATAEVCNWT